MLVSSSLAAPLIMRVCTRSCAAATSSPLAVAGTALHRASATQCASPTQSGCGQRRSYFYKYKKDFIPKGASTSPFQSSWTPSDRTRVIREYALAPLFGSRHAAILLGSRQRPSHFAKTKFLLGPLLDEILGLKNGTVEVGETQWLSDGSFPRQLSPQYRRMDSRTGEVLANCLVAVHLPEDFGPLDVIEAGAIIADAVYGGDGPYTNSVVSSGNNTSVAASSPPIAFDARLENDCGITYCELEVPDMNDHKWGRLLGADVDPDEAMAALDRWEARITAQLDRIGKGHAHAL